MNRVMSYSELISFFKTELRVQFFQIKNSFLKSPKLQGINPRKAKFEIGEDRAGDFAHCCAEIIPRKLFHIIITQAEKKIKVTVYNYRHWRQGEEKYSITVFPKKQRKK